MKKAAKLPPDPPVLLAPMAGITDLPFRRLALRFGAGMVVSEIVASVDFVNDRPDPTTRASLGDIADRTAVQIAGREAGVMAEAARIVEANGARVIDINMGCPAKKVVGGLSGSALMRDPCHALTLIEAVVGAVAVPVTVKTRLGWDDDNLNAGEIARAARDAGVAMVTIHGRTRCQFYKGRADWAAIGRAVNGLDLPVIANGDISNPVDAATAMRLAQAQGVMVGRASQGAPWLPGQIAAALAGRTPMTDLSGPDLHDLVQEHYAETCAFYPADLGPRVARKHLGWYMTRAGTPPALRQQVLTETDPHRVSRLLHDAFDQRAAKAA